MDKITVSGLTFIPLRHPFMSEWHQKYEVRVFKPGAIADARIDILDEKGTVILAILITRSMKEKHP